MERHKKIKKGFIILAIIIIIVGGLFISIGFYLINFSLKGVHRGLDLESSYIEMYVRYPFLESWVDSLKQEDALKDTIIINDHGVKLHGFYIDAAKPTKNTALIVHGYTDNAIRMFMIAYLYNRDLGYNVILPDLQFHGLSGGKAIQMGWKDRLDVLKWADLSINKYGEDSALLLHGISMGAATIMMTSGEDNLEQIKCYVEDCGYTSVWDEFSQELKEQFGLPSFPILNIASWLCDIRLGWNFKEASALESIKRCDKPMLFIHGDIDTFVPTWMVYVLYEAKSEPKELWIVNNTKHAEAYLNYKEEYTERVACFIKPYMLPNK